MRVLRRLIIALATAQMAAWIGSWFVLVASSPQGRFLGSLILAGIVTSACTAWTVIGTLLVYVYPDRFKKELNSVVASFGGLVAVAAMVFTFGNCIGSLPGQISSYEVLALVLVAVQLALLILWSCLMFTKSRIDGVWGHSV